ncbi:HlyD family efflux transporter periplasmic adaptor subunit [Defluviimonas sp. WL0002]|uniref:HlyD family efflux transporter periplasmic adaptor subunit n=1 Tax=Albidovulum marisflavi TaxID=2984159 RepID=A0ABT2Z7P9_9RHOB|nr:HlyD family efflux transporter periplasmic adaptor subunit [Defluviimonas sp. WL0002]MCV2867150.1 HlyD family efflux transporter periplasmic adaptor subunit [Defluviimonas sp. WL0002]
MILCSIPLIASLFTACTPAPPFATGYVEGDYVLVAPVATAEIAAIPVQRGDRVQAGALLAEMEREDAAIALTEARAALARAESELANLKQGRRPEEIRVLEAALASALAESAERDRAAERLASLAERGAATEAQRDDAATAAEVARARVAQAEADLAVARLPARPQVIAAAEATVEGARAALSRAEWTLAKRRLTAPAAGLVADVIRTPGEIAGPAAPILSLLPDGAVKLRLYVPETDVSRIHPGDRLEIRCDGCPDTSSATITYVSDEAEFTPPVIYSRENRQKLVYLIEAAPDVGSGLKPGQIVDVRLPGVRQ